MTFKPKNFDHLLGGKALSETLIKDHITLYQGYVMHTNKFKEILMEMMESGKETTPEFMELKRRFGYEWNGMKLHEYYFMNMAKTPIMPDKDSELAKKIADNYGSYEAWEKNFKAIGMIRGSGWAVTYYDPAIKRLINAWIDEHHIGHLAGLTPILVMDVFEHAYMVDYGIRRADYIEAFFKMINWEVVSARFELLRKMQKEHAAMK